MERILIGFFRHRDSIIDRNLKNTSILNMQSVPVVFNYFDIIKQFLVNFRCLLDTNEHLLIISVCLD